MIAYTVVDDHRYVTFVNTVLLTMDHFSQVKEAIWDARNKYDHFGVAVGIDQDTIDAIEKSCKKAEECFTQVLKECLRNGITQKKISDALKSKTVGYGRMGDEFLAVKFETPQKPASTSECNKTIYKVVL